MGSWTMLLVTYPSVNGINFIWVSSMSAKIVLSLDFKKGTRRGHYQKLTSVMICFPCIQGDSRHDVCSSQLWPRMGTKDSSGVLEGPRQQTGTARAGQDVQEESRTDRRSADKLLLLQAGRRALWAKGQTRIILRFFQGKSVCVNQHVVKGRSCDWCRGVNDDFRWHKSLNIDGTTALFLHASNDQPGRSYCITQRAPMFVMNTS